MYDMELSFGELIAIERVLADNHSGPLLDELYGGLLYFLGRDKEGKERILRPGEDESDHDDDDENLDGSIEGLDDPDIQEDEADGEIDREGESEAPEGEGHPADAYLEAPPANDTDSTGQGRDELGHEGVDNVPDIE